MNPFAELDSDTVTVSPGGEATVALTVRNGTDIVEAYEFEVVGDAASWVSVEPTRLSLYPGTQDVVSLVLRPPRSSEVRAGEIPLAVRVVPVERPELVSVPEMTVIIAPFWRHRASISPRRRRCWRTGKYRVDVHNQGNARSAISLVAADQAERLRFQFADDRPVLDPGEQREVRLRARTGGFRWFGTPSTEPFLVTAAGEVAAEEADQQGPEELDAELVQLPLLPRWLLALLALLLALLLAWFALLRPAVESQAREAASDQARQMAEDGELAPPPGGEQDSSEPPPDQGGDNGKPSEEQRPPGTGDNVVGGGQSSRSIEVRTNPGGTGAKSFTVPKGKVFFVTDLVLANYQGDEGLLTIGFHERTITTIALETFRNQDYHWVTPIEIPSEAEVSATVRCSRPGTPPSGQQAGQCVELLNVSGVLRDAGR